MRKRERERRIDSERRVWFENYRRQLADRLTRVCSSMPQSELDALTARMTRLYQRYKTVTGIPELR